MKHWLLTVAAEDFAKAAVPPCVFKAFMSARMTALSKPGGGIRGIATRTVFRRIVAKTLSRQSGPVVEASLPSPHGQEVDCVGHDNARMTVLSVDGVGAHDHVFTATMLSKLREVPGLQSLFPFVRQAYSSPSSYSWENEEGQRHTIEQHEGGEQGDPIALQFGHPQCVEGHLESGELLFAFYVVCLPHRVRSIFNLLDDRLSTMVGIRHHEGNHGCGTELESIPRRLRSWVQKFGVQRASRSWARQLGQGACGQGGGRTIGGGTEVGPRRAVRMASVGAVRRTQMPPLLAHITTIPNRGVRRRS